MQETIKKLRDLAVEVDQVHSMAKELMPEALALDDKTYFAGGANRTLHIACIALEQMVTALDEAARLAEAEMHENEAAAVVESQGMEADPCTPIIA